MIGFIFPASYESIKKCDEAYESQFSKLKEAGFPVFLIDIDNLADSKIYPVLTDNLKLIYRGWMLNQEKYELLNNMTAQRLMTDVNAYINSHHSPNWYKNVADLTFEKIITDEASAPELFTQSGWSAAVIKDYVKSLKTGKGSVVTSAQDVIDALANMKKYKGFLEGGVVFNKFVDLDNQSETRFFVLNGGLYHDDSVKDENLIDFARQVSKRHDEFFYSVDISKDLSGKIYLVEIGDGQVSDITGWSEDNFIKMFDAIKIKKTLKP